MSPFLTTLNSHRNKYLYLSHAMKIFDEEDEIQIHHLPKTTKQKDTVVLIKEGDVAGLKILMDSMLVSVKYQGESGFTLLHYAASHNQVAITNIS